MRITAGDTIGTRVEKDEGTIIFLVNGQCVVMEGFKDEPEVFFTVSMMSQPMFGEPAVVPCQFSLIDK